MKPHVMFCSSLLILSIVCYSCYLLKVEMIVFLREPASLHVEFYLSNVENTKWLKSISSLDDVKILGALGI